MLRRERRGLVDNSVLRSLCLHRSRGGRSDRAIVRSNCARGSRKASRSSPTARPGALVSARTIEHTPALSGEACRRTCSANAGARVRLATCRHTLGWFASRGAENAGLRDRLAVALTREGAAPANIAGSADAARLGWPSRIGARAGSMQGHTNA